MSCFEEIVKGSVSTVLVGIGAAIVAPTVFRALASAMRTEAKAIIKGGILVYDGVKETVAEAGE